MLAFAMFMSVCGDVIVMLLLLFAFQSGPSQSSIPASR